LYDITADPHEINNLVACPEHGEVLTRMRRLLADWMAETNDLGLIPEEDLNERVRPGGQWSTTAAPCIAPQGGVFPSRAEVTLQRDRRGSFAYTTETAIRLMALVQTANNH
jgi:hypothetical protein